MNTIHANIRSTHARSSLLNRSSGGCKQPLDMNRVKRRQASGQGTVPYLEGYDVIEAANDLFLFRWSFDLLSEPHIMRWDKVITFYDQRAKKKVPVLGRRWQANHGDRRHSLHHRPDHQSNWMAKPTATPTLGAASSMAIHPKPWIWPSPEQSPTA